MESVRLTLRPLSAFGGSIYGDTLFGQLCWAACNRWGQGRLTELLEGYLQGQPFAICSDAFPKGYLPRPALPLYRFDQVPDTDRKAAKKRHWLPLEAISEPVQCWLTHCLSDAEVAKALGGCERKTKLMKTRPQPHNTIDRRTGTTGLVDFAPYTVSQLWYRQHMELDCYVLFESSRIECKDMVDLLADIGKTGYGRDASIGLGKFEIQSEDEIPTTKPGANACMTLAPCAPQGLGFNAEHCYYEVFTRFGRHGDRAVFKEGGPFKAPVLLTASGALLSIDPMPLQPFIGQGLGGNGVLSKAIPETVQQGYAPFFGVQIKREVALA